MNSSVYVCDSYDYYECVTGEREKKRERVDHDPFEEDWYATRDLINRVCLIIVVPVEWLQSIKTEQSSTSFDQNE